MIGRRNVWNVRGREGVDVLVVVAHRGEQVADVVVVQGVMNVAPRAPRTDEPQHAQNPQVMRGRARAEIGGLSEPFDCALTIDQFGQEPQPSARAQRLEGLRELIGLVRGEGP